MIDPSRVERGADASLSATAPNPELPTVAEVIETLRGPVRLNGSLVVLYFNFDRYGKIEEIYGWERLDAMLSTTARELRRLLATTPLRDAFLSVTYRDDDDFVVFHCPTNSAHGDSDVTPELIRRVRDGVAQGLEREYGVNVASLFDVYIGRAVVEVDPKVRFERQVYRGVREAAGNAHNVEQEEHEQLVRDLRETVRTGAVYIDYHPITNTRTGKIFGYEALARGTMRALRRPEVMFSLAEEAGLVWDLSRLCRRRAIEGIPSVLQDGESLFLNVDPHDFVDSTFTPDDLGVDDPTRVVLEITERIAISDYPHFRERLRAFRDRGFRFAVDDAGSGYAGLGSIANLEPDFIKLDLSLITGIDTNFIKQDLVRSIVKFANDQGAEVIAEWVEREAEYDTVRQLGVQLVQGFFLHPPQHLPDESERAVGGA